MPSLAVPAVIKTLMCSVLVTNNQTWKWANTLLIAPNVESYCSNNALLVPECGTPEFSSCCLHSLVSPALRPCCNAHCCIFHRWGTAKIKACKCNECREGCSHSCPLQWGAKAFVQNQRQPPCKGCNMQRWVTYAQFVGIPLIALHLLLPSFLSTLLYSLCPLSWVGRRVDNK